MSFPAYPKYKDSGVEWLGEVPEHWGVDRLKRSIGSCKNGIWGEEASGNENDIPCVRVADFDRQRLRVQLNEPTIRNVSIKERAGRVLEQGDLLLEKSGGGEQQLVGCVVLYDESKPAVCSNFVARMKLSEGMNSSFWRYVHAAAYSIRLTMGSINQTSGIQNLDQDRYFNERATFPPLFEQQTIATFLDRETSKIDALVSEQETLIELLKERRQALISEAVTGKFDVRTGKPYPKYKDSGVEWLGEVPEGWRIVPNKIFLTAIGSEVGNRWDQTQLLSLSIKGIVPRDIDSGEGKYPSDFSTYQLVYMGDLVFCLFDMDETPRTVGLSDREGMITSAYSIFRCKPCANPEYIYNYYLHIDSFKGLRPFYTGLRKVVRPSTFLAVKLALPPIDQQYEIAKFIRCETFKIDALVTEADRSIELLKERRSALISAAVTGKIDLRNYAQESRAA